MRTNKRGWILIIESVFAILILFGFLFTTLSKIKQESMIQEKTGEEIYSIANELAIKAEKNVTIRNAVLGKNENIINNWLIENLRNKNQNLNGTSKVCDINLISCTSGSLPAKEIYSSEVIVAANSTYYKPEKLKIFIWKSS